MAKYNFDQVHSTLEFSIKHLMVSRVKGTFENYNVEINGDVNDLSSLEAVTTIDVESINTNNKDRDNHLKSADFFNTDETNKSYSKLKKSLKTQ